MCYIVKTFCNLRERGTPRTTSANNSIQVTPAMDLITRECRTYYRVDTIRQSLSSTVPQTIQGPSSSFHISRCITTYSDTSLTCPVPGTTSPLGLSRAKLCFECNLTTACRSAAPEPIGNSVARCDTTRGWRTYLCSVQQRRSPEAREAMRPRKELSRPSVHVWLSVEMSALSQGISANIHVAQRHNGLAHILGESCIHACM